MLDRIQNTIQQECRLGWSEPVLIGVSGGPDSLCLVDLLDRLGYPLVVAHLNHKLRPEADKDAYKVRQLAEIRGWLFTEESEDTKDYAQTQSLSIEEAARTVRYRFLFEQAEHYHAQAVAVGHTADDQVETVLMHLLRGAGLSGLRGMQTWICPNTWSETIPLVRPLLGFWREEVVTYCQEHGLETILDRTNLELTYFRNRLRHALLPYLSQYNPAVKQVLWRTAGVLAGDYEVIEQVVESAWTVCVREHGGGFVALDSAELARQLVGVQRHLVRKAIAWLRPGLRDIDFQAVEGTLCFLADPPATRQRDLVAGLRLLLDEGSLWIAAWEADLPAGGWPQLNPREALTLEVPGELCLPDGWRLHAEKIEFSSAVRAEAMANPDPYQAWADLEALDLPVLVRGRQPGDRFKPLGLEGHSIKIADFMINKKLPRRARPGWPLVCSGEQVVWLPGLQLGHSFRLKPDTRKALKFHLFHTEKGGQQEDES